MYKNEIPAEFVSRGIYRSENTSRMNSEHIDKIAAIEAEVEKLNRELAESRELRLRLAADFDNYRKRTARDLEQRAARQKEALARDLLPTIDNLFRALSAPDGESLRRGIELIHNELMSAMESHGFKARNDLGAAFDGRFHDAIALGCNPGMPDHSVIEVWERGWMKGDEMFRPAKVLVNKLEAAEPDGGTKTAPTTKREREFAAS